MSGLPRIVVVVVVAFGISAALVPLCRRLALAIDLVDRPSSRKVHSAPVPYLGGLAVAAATLATLGAFGGFTDKTRWILVCAAATAAIGLVDDETSISPGRRLGLEAALAAAVVATGTQLNLTGFIALDAPATVLFIVALTNALNLCDNMDGLAAGLSFAGSVSLLICALLVGSAQLALLGGAVAGAVLGFVVYNGPPAAIFMGDSGSLFLGFMFSSLAVSVSHALERGRGLVVVALACGIVLLDMFTVMVARTRNGISVTTAGRDHLSHRLAASGFSRPQSAGILVGLSLLLGIGSSLVVSNQVAPLVALPASMLSVTPCMWVAWRTQVYQRDLIVHQGLGLEGDGSLSTSDTATRLTG